MPRPRRARTFPLEVREPVDEPVVVYRSVRTADRDDLATLERGFRSQAARGLPPRPGTAQEGNPFIYNGVSAFTTLEAAIDNARVLREAGQPVGDYVAELRLDPGEGFEYAEWRTRPGHLTVRGDPIKLYHAVVDIVMID